MPADRDLVLKPYRLVGTPFKILLKLTTEVTSSSSKGVD